MNSDLSTDDDRQDVSTTTTPPINSKSKFNQPIIETRQHDKKKIPKKLEVIMIDKVIMTTTKEDERFLPLI